MKLKELVAELQKEDPERIVICASDAEGNNYSPLYSFWIGEYKNGEVRGYDETDYELKGAKPAIIFSPE